MGRFTTLKIGGDAEKLVVPESIDDLLSLLERLSSRSIPWHLIGGGSNLLVSSRGVPGTVIRTTGLTEMTVVEPGIIEAHAGARLPHLTRFALANSLSGLEFAVGIPGTVGGAVVMNAGAHGSDIAACLEQATIFDTSRQELRELSGQELDFSYRRSAIDPTKQVVLKARFRLTADSLEAIEARIRHNEEYRWRTQPVGFPSGGSTFKNPDETHSAGYLLDQAGAKHLREGAAAVSAVHANFVINLGGARSGEVTELLRRMQAAVKEKFSLSLEPEWKRLGIFSPAEESIWNGR